MIKIPNYPTLEREMIINERWLVQAAQLVCVDLTRAQIPGVMAYLQRTAELARIVNDFVLDPEADEPGPTWKL